MWYVDSKLTAQNRFIIRQCKIVSLKPKTITSVFTYDAVMCLASCLRELGTGERRVGVGDRWSALGPRELAPSSKSSPLLLFTKLVVAGTHVVCRNLPFSFEKQKQKAELKPQILETAKHPGTIDLQTHLSQDKSRHYFSTTFQMCRCAS